MLDFLHSGCNVIALEHSRQGTQRSVLITATGRLRRRLWKLRLRRWSPIPGFWIHQIHRWTRNLHNLPIHRNGRRMQLQVKGSRWLRKIRQLQHHSRRRKRVGWKIVQRRAHVNNFWGHWRLRWLLHGYLRINWLWHNHPRRQPRSIGHRIRSRS